jgi:hypothetical protein
MESIHGFDFFSLHFDRDGKLEQPHEFEELKQHVGSAGVTDAIFMAHGFRNDENDARGLYTEFLKTFRANLGRPEFEQVSQRRFVAAGIFWPSKTFRESFGEEEEGTIQGIADDAAEKKEVKRKLEELKSSDASGEQKPKIQEAIQLLDKVEDSTDAQDRFVKLVLSLLDDSKPDPTEGLQNIRAKEGSELLKALEEPLFLPTVETDHEGGVMAVDTGGVGDAGGTQGVFDVFGSVFGRIGQFLNATTWYLMKDRSGTVGANGVAQAVRDLKAAHAGVKIHLVGHSLGGRLMAACAKSLAQPPKVEVDSLTLLQAAFSHYGFSSNLAGQPGFFRDAITGQVVRGPFISTYSAKDTVVGRAYAIASRLAGDNIKAFGDENDEFGGVGRNGCQNSPESIVEPLHAVGAPYTFTSGRIVNLNGSKDLINSHGDVRNPNVTYAFASAVAGT